RSTSLKQILAKPARHVDANVRICGARRRDGYCNHARNRIEQKHPDQLELPSMECPPVRVRQRAFRRKTGKCGLPSSEWKTSSPLGYQTGTRGSPDAMQSRPTLRRHRGGCPDRSGVVPVTVATSSEVLDPDPGTDERIERVLIPLQCGSGQLRSGL